MPRSVPRSTVAEMTAPGSRTVSSAGAMIVNAEEEPAQASTRASAGRPTGFHGKLAASRRMDVRPIRDLTAPRPGGGSITGRPGGDQNRARARNRGTTAYID